MPVKALKHNISLFKLEFFIMRFKKYEHQYIEAWFNDDTKRMRRMLKKMNAILKSMLIKVWNASRELDQIR